MNTQQAERMQKAHGFIAALDQSGGSTPKALAAYGISPDMYKDEDQMFDLVHEMRTRIITARPFRSERILAAILFEQTMDRLIEGKHSGDYLWENKGIIPFVKVDKGLAEKEKGVQLMKPMPQLEQLLERAVKRHIFGTKMRSLIHEADEEGIRQIVAQQFAAAEKILSYDLMPIIEPEVSIKSPAKVRCEEILKAEILKQLAELPAEQKVMLKLTIPSEDDFYKELIEHPQVLRVVALSGGYSRAEANERLSRQHGMIASFSRALAQDLRYQQTDEEFTRALEESIQSIYEASLT